MTEKIELLPCPACGKTPHLQFDPNRRYFVECMECDIYLYAYTAYAPTCVRAWNDFVEATQPQWQPMDTAPRDGTKVVIANYAGGVDCMRWYIDDDGDACWMDGRNEYYCDEKRAIGWMPLPPSPTAEGDA